MTREPTRIDGEIDLARAGEVLDLVKSSLETELPLVLDLTGVTFMDVAGFRAIWEPTRQIDARECAVVALASERVARLVDLLGVNDPRIRFVAMGNTAGSSQAGSGPGTRWWRSPVFDHGPLRERVFLSVIRERVAHDWEPHPSQAPLGVSTSVRQT